MSGESKKFACDAREEKKWAFVSWKNEHAHV
jgi:hypothetical protein